MLRRAPLASAVVTLALPMLVGACERSGARAPTWEGCWQTTAAQSGGSRFRLLDEQPSNLESCAADLELQFLNGHRPVSAVYEGFDLFADRSGVWGRDGQTRLKYPVFTAPVRARLDRTLAPALPALRMQLSVTTR